MTSRCRQCSGPLPAAARFCPQCGASVGDAPIEERKLVTILFADITGSTRLGERFDPERWRTLLQRFFSVMAASIESWGGTVQKFAGDAVMASFGVPIVREDDAERALRAGCEMLDRLADLNREFEIQHGVSLAIRIGINTGEVMAASDQLLVIGDAVNVAARLQHMADPGTILAGDRTCEAARGAFDFGPQEMREVRGKGSPVMVRRVVRPLAARSERRSGLHVPMVGREVEVEALAGLFHEAMDSNAPRMAIVTGPAGIGKSRLVREFLNLSAARHPERILLQGRCPSAGKDMTYWALGELLRRECGISLDDSSRAAADRIRSRVHEVLAPGGLATEEIERTLYALALTAGIKLDANPLEQVRPSAVDLELAIAWPRFISAYAASAPVVLLIEDLHWADDRLVTMIERLLARSTGPLLIVGTARPDFHDTHAGFGASREDVELLTLRRLTSQQSQALLDELVTRRSIESSFRDDLLASADGNPFFLEEIVQRLNESGALAGGPRVRSATGGNPSLPDTVQAVLSARIDGLPPRQKRALQEAAVIGRTFWEEPLQRASGDPDLSATMLALEGRDLISLRPTSTVSGELEFAFKHALVRDVAYGSLPLGRRARAHAEVARWLEEKAGDRRDELAELIAYHYRNAIRGEGAELAWAEEPARRAELEARAMEVLVSAGIRARRRFAIGLALELHQDALALARSTTDRARILEAIGDDQEGAFHGDEAVASWEAATALLNGTGEPSAERVRLLVKCAKMTCIRWGGFKTVPPTRQVDGYIDAALAAGPDEHDRGWLLAMRSYLNTRKGDPREIEAIPRAERARAGEEAAEIGRNLGDAELEVLALRALSGLWISAGDYRKAMEVTEQEPALFDRIAATRDRALAVVFYTLRLMDIDGRYDAGLTWAQESHRLGKELTIHEVQHATFLLLYGNAMLGRWTAIDPLLEEHLDAWRKEQDISCPYARGGPLIAAWALARQGRREEARRLIDEMPMDWTTPALPEAWRGMARLQAGDAAGAREDAHKILAANRRISYEEAPLEYAVMLDALIAQQEWKALEDFMPKAEAMRDGLATLGPACDRAAGMLAFSRGEPAAGRAALQRAISGFERLGVVPESDATRELMASTARPV